MKMRLWMLALAVAGAGGAGLSEEVPEAVRLAAMADFRQGEQLIGGRVLPDLVRKCALIDDEVVGKLTGTPAKQAVMRCLNGRIGPLNYVHEKFKGMDLDGGGGNSSFGTAWKGSDNVGPKVQPMKGRYVIEASPKFDEGIRRWNAAARKRCAPACGELAALVFTEAAQGSRLGLDDDRMYGYFRFAAAAGSSDAIFMCAVCEYYGIGTKRSRAAAYASLRLWKDTAGVSKARKDTWVGRRFLEMSEAKGSAGKRRK